MEILEITPETIRREDDAALLNLHRHMHGLWAQHFEGNDETGTDGLTREDLVNAHVTVRHEMERRKMQHAAEPRDGLDRAAGELKALEDVLAEGHEDVILVPKLVAVTGSVGEGRVDPADLDVLVRADRVEGQGGPGFFVRAEDLELPLRKRLDPEKTGLGIHWNANPQGPHDTHLALADLVLRWRNPPEREEVKAGRRLRQVRVEQLERLLKEGREFMAELEELLGWAQYADAEAEGEGSEAYVIYPEQYPPLRAMTGADLASGGALVPEENTQPEEAEAKAVSPGKRYEVMKPGMAGVTEYFGVGELWDGWAAGKLEEGHSLLGSPKIDGFRAVVGWDGKAVSVWFEDSKENKVPPGMPGLSGPSFVVEGEFTARRGNRWLARTQLAGALAGGEEASPHFWLYDLLYHDGEDVSDRPFSERLELLRKLRLPKANFTLLAQRPVGSKNGLESVGKWAAGRPLSEGLFLRQADAPYAFGATGTCAKWKTIFEIKVRVLEVSRRENGYVYRCGLRGGGGFANTVEAGGESYLDLGNTFVSKDGLADEGDTLNVRIEELIVLSGPRLAWGKPTPVGVDRSRPAYQVAQAVSLARRGRVLKEEVEAKALREEETRNEVADRLWAQNWPRLVARGEGKFILHGHFPALDADQKDLPLEKLLAAGASYHTDRRHEAPAPYGAWGFTGFEGESEKVGPKGTRLHHMPPGEAMRGTFKLEQPREWLTYARDGPKLNEDVGRTGKDFAKFFALDWGKYKLTFAREHSFEIVYDGEKGVQDGRYQINYVPVEGGRVWMTSRPAEQDAIYADEHDLEKVAEELRGKGQKWLFWRDSLDAPLRKIDVTRSDGGKAMSELDLDQKLTDLELSEIGMSVKAAFDLRKALDKALDAIRGKQARAAIAALRGVLENTEEYGQAYGYGYPAPKAAKDAERIKKLAQQTIDLLDQDDPDFDKALGLVQRIEKELGYGETGKAAPKEATRLRDQIMSAVGELNKDEPDYEKVARVLQAALGKLPEQEAKAMEEKSLAIKVLREEDDGVVVGGYLLLWGDPEKKDLAGDYFTPETQLWLEEYKSVPALFHHGLDEQVGLAVMGHRVKAAKDEVGAWVEDWLDKSKKYWQMVKPLLDAKALYYSPGSAPHLVEREKDGKLKSFPVVEDTMTPIPCQHRLLPVEQIKAVYAQSNIKLPEALAAEPLDVAAELAALEEQLKALEVTP